MNHDCHDEGMMGVIVPSPHEHPPSPLTLREGGIRGLNQDCHDGGMMGVIPSRPSSVDSRLRGDDGGNFPLRGAEGGCWSDVCIGI